MHTGPSGTAIWTLKEQENEEKCKLLSLKNGERKLITTQRYTKKGRSASMIKNKIQEVQARRQSTDV
jgi:hypothetical protein